MQLVWPETIRSIRSGKPLGLKPCRWLCLFVSLAWFASFAGCNRNPFTGMPYGTSPYAASPYGVAPPTGAPGMMPNYAQPQLAEMERRVQQLDVNNRQLTTQLAQSQQQMQVFRDRADLLQKQLQDTTSQLQQARIAQQDLQGQARGMQASMSMRGGATLRPNVSAPPGQPVPGTQAPPSIPGTGINSGFGASNQMQPVQPQAGAGLGSLTSAALNAQPSIQVPGAIVQSEGNVLRIRVPADQLFAQGAAQLNPNAYQVLDNVATAILRYFPRQRVAVEGHTDNGSLYGGAFTTPYQLATAQAQAVADQLVRRNTLPSQQLTVVAHGPNFPRGDNQTPSGRAENRRIEFVVYPETF